MKTYRDGPLGALMDEYERAAGELVSLLKELSDEDYELVRDTTTADEDCRSIKTISTHVVRAGYGYAAMLRKAWGIDLEGKWPGMLGRQDALAEMPEMLAYTAATLDGRWEISEDEATALQIQSSWGPIYDLEQLLEHAIVHVLRHRRQIERFLDQ
jgi:uncharacterized damage-inducible protein DinB